MADVRTVAIVDDDAAIREALADLLRSCGYKTEVFPSAEAFLESGGRGSIDCIILDVRMTGMSGLELQDALVAEGSAPPRIFMTSQNDDATQRIAIKGGACGFLGKPVDDEVLLSSLESAFRG